MAGHALLLGHKTYEGFAAAWPSRTDDQGFAEKMTSMRKYVVSRTLKNPEWNNMKVVSGEVVGEISNFKQQRRGDLLVYGSCMLVQTLIEDDLVDSCS